MQVRNDSSSMNSYYNMIQKKKQEEEEQKKLSTGFKINAAADDPAGLCVSEKMRAQITIANQAAENATIASKMVNVGEGAMQEINSLLNRATEISAQASNGTYNDDDRAAMQMEIDQLAEELNRITQSTNFNGVSILDGSISTESGSLEFQIGTDSLSYSQMEFSANVSIDFSKLSVLSVEEAAESLAMLEEFVNTITAERGEMGAKTNRLDYTVNSLNTMVENLQSAESRIRDTDMAKAATEKNNQSTQLKLAMANNKNTEEQKKGVLNLFA